MSDELAPVAYREESWGEEHFILEIRIKQKREFNEEDNRILWKVAGDIKRALAYQNNLLDPGEIKAKREWIEKVREMFAAAGFLVIFMEEIPNEYWTSRPNDPWLLVTTPLGHIKIGWRKRVIVIDWERTSIKESADEIFPDEDVTKMETAIHAWGYAKAQEYLTKLYQVGYSGEKR